MRTAHTQFGGVGAAEDAGALSDGGGNARGASGPVGGPPPLVARVGHDSRALALAYDDG